MSISIQNQPVVKLNSPSEAPRWRSLLHQRGITDAAVAFAGIHANGSGWVYPIAPSVATRRWKAFDSSASPKYLWQPAQPDNARFYDPRGQLAMHIAAAGGVLILASGEADAWVCYSAGLFNVTCTLHGEGTIPDWFVPELHRLGVKMLRLGPDRDNAGLKHAAKVVAALAGSGIAVEIYALPYADDSKADLNTLWLDCACDRTQFMAALEACPPLDLPTSEQLPHPRTNYTPPAVIASLREHYCTDYVERAAVSAWQIAPPNGKGLSRSNFSSPLRDDRNPSAQWNYAVHGFKDYGDGGEFYNTDQVADLLGLSTWAEYKVDHVPTVPNCISCTLTDPVKTELIPLPRYYENGIPRGVRELLNNWHNNPWVHIEGNDVPPLDSLYTYLEVRHDLIFQGVTEPHTALSAHELALLNRFGVAYRTLRSAEKTGELLQFLFPYEDDSYIGKETATISAGRPAARYQLPVLDDFWKRFFDAFRFQMWRALLVSKYPDLPVDLLTYDDVLLAMDDLQGLANYDAIGTINDTIHPLLVEHDARLREAQAELEWRIAELYRRYIWDAPPLYMLAPGVTFSKTSQHKDLHLVIRMQREGGVIENRYEAAREGGWTLPAYRAALKRAEQLLNEAIVTVPNFTERGTITTGGERVIAACEAQNQNAYLRGRIKLHAANGEQVTVSPGYARRFDYDQWLEDNGGRAAVLVWENSIDKLERLETADEKANRVEVSNRQKAINSRRDYEAEAAARADRAHEPGVVETWVQTQGALIAPLFDVDPADPQRWRAIFETVEVEDEQAKTENTTVGQTGPSQDESPAENAPAAPERPASVHCDDARCRSRTGQGSDSGSESRSERAGDHFPTGHGTNSYPGPGLSCSGADDPGCQDSGTERVHAGDTPAAVVNEAVPSPGCEESGLACGPAETELASDPDLQAAPIVTYQGERGFWLPSGRFWRLIEPDKDVYKRKYDQER